MAQISSTTTHRLVSTSYATQGERALTTSSRQATPSEQITLAQPAGGEAAESTSLTYGHLAQDSKRGPSLISSQSSPGLTNPPEKETSNHLENMASVKALVARYGDNNPYSEEMKGWSERIRLDPETGERRFVNDGGINEAPRAKTGDLFELSLKTKDGDTVTVSISAEQLDSLGEGSMAPELEMKFSFSVAGDLSEAERDAVDSLMSRLDDIADEYQQHDWADVEFMESFDNSTLSGFSLNVAGDNGNELNIEYSLDFESGGHTLSVNQNGYEYELSADNVLNQTGSAFQANATYQQYQQVLIDTTRSYEAGEFSGGVSSSKAVEFFMDGLQAVFSPLDSDKSDSSSAGASKDAPGGARHDAGLASRDDVESESPNSSLVEMKARNDGPAGSFLSGLPDFIATFNTPAFLPNSSNSGEVSQMTLRLDQVTDISVDPSSGVKTLVQSYSYDSQVSQHFGIGGDSMRHANLGKVSEPGGQTYVYEVVRQSATLARSVELGRDGTVIDYREDKDSEHTKTTKEVVNGNIEKQQKENLTAPHDNYSFALQAPLAPAALEAYASRVEGYRDIQILNDAIRSQHIDLYS